MLAVNANPSQPPTRALRVRFPACADDADYELLVEERPGGQTRSPSPASVSRASSGVRHT